MGRRRTGRSTGRGGRRFRPGVGTQSSKYRATKGKGNDFEYDWMWYMKYHGFENVRSYASIGIADVRSIPPIQATSQLPCYAQCKNTAKEDYVEPSERARLEWCAKTYHCLVVEPFKKDHTCFVKIEPWELDGKIMTPEDFLEEYYGIVADDWTTWRNNWFPKTGVIDRVYTKPDLDIEMPPVYKKNGQWIWTDTDYYRKKYKKK